MVILLSIWIDDVSIKLGLYFQPPITIINSRKIIILIKVPKGIWEGVKRQSYFRQVSREKAEGVTLVDVKSNKGVNLND